MRDYKNLFLAINCYSLWYFLRTAPLSLLSSLPILLELWVLLMNSTVPGPGCCSGRGLRLSLISVLGANRHLSLPLQNPRPWLCTRRPPLLLPIRAVKRQWHPLPGPHARSHSRSLGLLFTAAVHMARALGETCLQPYHFWSSPRTHSDWQKQKVWDSFLTGVLTQLNWEIFLEP